MKKLLCYFFSVTCTMSHLSCDKESGEEMTPQPLVTARGLPQGQVTTREIGPEGGQLQLADGSVSIRIPAGALSAPATVGIQPISNTAPLGIGRGYRLTPEGVTFAKPVTITLKYSPDSLAGTSPDFLWIASQNTDGSWVGHRKSVVDVNAKTVSTEALHFSDWVTGVFVKMSLKPAEATVKVKESIALSVSGFWGEQNADDELAALIPAPQRLHKLASKAGTFSIDGWTLNGAAAPQGNAAGALNIAEGGKVATYTAPEKVPSQNPVAVAVSMTQTQTNGHKTRWSLVSNLLIRDKYFASFTINGAETVFSGNEIFDGSSGGAANGNLAQALQSGNSLTLVLKSNTKDMMVSLGLENPKSGSFPFYNEKNEKGVQVTSFKLSAPSHFLSTYSSTMSQFIKGSNGNCDLGASSSGNVTVTEYKDEKGATVSGTFTGTLWNLGNAQNCTNSSVQISGAFALPLFK